MMKTAVLVAATQARVGSAEYSSCDEAIEKIPDVCYPDGLNTVPDFDGIDETKPRTDFAVSKLIDVCTDDCIEAVSYSVSNSCFQPNMFSLPLRMAMSCAPCVEPTIRMLDTCGVQLAADNWFSAVYEGLSTPTHDETTPCIDACKALTATVGETCRADSHQAKTAAKITDLFAACSAQDTTIETSTGEKATGKTPTGDKPTGEKPVNGAIALGTAAALVALLQ